MSCFSARFPFYSPANTKEIVHFSKMSPAVNENRVEVICETRNLATKVKWFVGTEDVYRGGRFAIKQYGYSHRLLIKNLQSKDVVFADAGRKTFSDNLSMYISFTYS